MGFRKKVTPLFPYQVDMHMNEATDMQKLEKEFLLSIQAYEEIRDFLEKLDREIGIASASGMLDTNNRLTELQRRATLIDRSLIEQLSPQAKPPEKLQSLDERRRYLVAEIILVNKRVTEKAKAVRAYLSYEKKKIRTGFMAMSGYGQQHQLKQGRIVNRSF